MMKTLLFLILFATASFSAASAAAGEKAGLTPGELQAMEQKLASIRNPAAKLFFKAGIERLQGRPEEAIKILADLIVHHAHEKKWIARSELMSAELYLELGMPDAADATARQVQIMYEGTDNAERARELRSKIETLRQEPVQ